MSQFVSSNSIETPARQIACTVLMMFLGAMDVTAIRASAPDAFPTIPPDADPAWWARRTLARLADNGVTPDGWEEEFFLPFLDTK